MANRGGTKTRVRKAVLKYLNLELSKQCKKELDIVIGKTLKNTDN